MKFIESTTWQEVYDNWKSHESKNKHWEEFYKEKGHSSWDSFRNFYIKPSRATELKWELYDVEPTEIPKFQCGLFKGWKELSEKAESRLFKDLSEADHFQNHEKIKELKAEFPNQTHLIAFQKGPITTMFEGHHRCIAISQLEESGISVNSKITLALAKVDPNSEHPFIDFLPPEIIR